MARGEFERDMSDYLRARKRARGINVKELFNKFLNKIPRRVEMPEEVEVYHEEEKKRNAAKRKHAEQAFQTRAAKRTGTQSKNAGRSCCWGHERNIKDYTQHDQAAA